MTDHGDASQPGGRHDFGCGMMFWLYIVVFPIVGWIVYPILKQVFGKTAPYALVAGCGAVLLWGWFRERRRRLGGRSL